MKAAQSLEIQKEYIQGYKAQLAALDAHLQELKTAKETIQGYSKLAKDDEVLIPVGGGFFVPGSIRDTRTVISHVGANISVQESHTRAQERLEENIVKMESSRGRLSKELQSIEEQFASLSRKLEEAYAGMHQHQGDAGDHEGHHHHH